MVTMPLPPSKRSCGGMGDWARAGWRRCACSSSVYQRPHGQPQSSCLRRPTTAQSPRPTVGCSGSSSMSVSDRIFGAAVPGSWDLSGRGIWRLTVPSGSSARATSHPDAGGGHAAGAGTAMWSVLDNDGGSSDTGARVRLLDRYLAIFGAAHPAPARGSGVRSGRMDELPQRKQYLLAIRMKEGRRDHRGRPSPRLGLAARVSCVPDLPAALVGDDAPARSG